MNPITQLIDIIGPIKAANPPPQPYAGMDASGYPGTPVMTNALALSNIVWTGMYIDSPAAVPGELARPQFTRPDGSASIELNANGEPKKDENGNTIPRSIPYGHWGNAQTSWLKKDAWNQLYPAWGMLPIYWGQQDPRNADGPFDPRAIIAVPNADEAATKAAAAGIPAGAVIYIDWEIGANPSAAGVAYCTAWFQHLAELGYRPGVYCHPPASLAFRKQWPRLFVWNVNLARFGTLSVDHGRLVLAVPMDLNVRGGETPDPDCIARQWKFGVEVHTGNPVAGFPGIDANASTVADPAFPERRVIPSLVRGGMLTGAIVDASTLEFFAIRRGALKAQMWAPGTPPTITAATLPAEGLSCNPWSVNAALQRGTSGDLALIARSDTLDAADNSWNLHAYRRRGTTWTFDSAINGATPLEPLLGVSLVSRAADTTEAFFLTNDGSNQIFVVSCIDAPAQADSQTWAAPVVVNAATGGMQPSVVGGIASVSRGPGTTDVFVVAKATGATTWQLFWNSSSTLGTWPLFSVPGDPTVTLHPFSNIAAVSRGSQLVDVFAIGKRPADTNWTLYNWSWNATNSWGDSGSYNLQGLGAGWQGPHPVSKVEVASRSAQSIDVFVVGATDGLLYTATWNGAASTWGAFQLVGTNKVTVGSVDGAFCRDANSVEVIVTGRDGNVYVSSLDSASGTYSDLAAIAAFNLT